MNAQSTNDVNNPRMRRRRRTWLTRDENVITPESYQVPPRSSISWEAYVVETETNQAVEAYPRLSDSDVIEVDELHRNYEVEKLYIAKASKLPDVNADLLEANVASGHWSISTHITSTRPLT